MLLEPPYNFKVVPCLRLNGDSNKPEPIGLMTAAATGQKGYTNSSVQAPDPSYDNNNHVYIGCTSRAILSGKRFEVLYR